MTGTAGLEQLQNADGGWGFRAGGSWTEPTCYALLALSAAGSERSEACRRGANWLAARQRSDGGFAPRESVEESTWVTALPLLLPEALLPKSNRDRAGAWLASQTGKETSFIFRLRMRLLNVRLENVEFDGWPWFPGAAAWVTPTALSVLAMEKYSASANAAQWKNRIEQGQRFLLSRRCSDGGWNHGSSKALGYDSGSYPETTGAALLALHDLKSPELSAAESLAERLLSDCPSAEAANWLRLGLIARGKKAAASPRAPRNITMELAMAALADAAADGRNILLA